VPSLGAVASRIEKSADALAAWMRSIPINGDETQRALRRDLSLRAGERYEVARELRAIAAERDVRI
jgi:hypothetical protein